MKDTLTLLHQSTGIPTTRTLLKSIWNNNLSTWTFMTDRNIRKFLPHSIPTAMGNQYRTRKKFPIYYSTSNNRRPKTGTENNQHLRNSQPSRNSIRQKLLWSKWNISHPINQWEQINYGHLHIWTQRHSRRAPTGNNQGVHPPSTPKYYFSPH